MNVNQKLSFLFYLFSCFLDIDHGSAQGKDHKLTFKTKEKHSDESYNRLLKNTISSLFSDDEDDCCSTTTTTSTIVYTFYSLCNSDPFFEDSLGNDCDWYDEDSCGDTADANAVNVSANVACCSCGGGYDFYPFSDSFGNDIQQEPVSTMFQECDLNFQCVGFNSNGWLKTYIAPQSEWVTFSNDTNPLEGLYVKKTTDLETTAPDGFNFLPFTDSFGNDIEQMVGGTVSDFAEKCYANPQCIGFNTNGYLKNDVLPLSEFDKWNYTDASEGLYLRKEV